jgi:predicted DCC family thiol-disulfide oxidoreductase YuxK
MNARALLIFYDANCNLCRTIRSALSGSDAALQFVDIHDPKIAEKYPKLRGLPLGCQMHVIDEGDALTGGYDAMVVIASRIPSMQPFIPLMKWKPVRSVGWNVYRFIARHRYTIFGSNGAAEVCTIAQ